MPFELHRPCRAFLFDLDGTLIDSKADIANSINLTLKQLRLPPIAISRISEFVGDGVYKLVQRTLREVTGSDPEDGQIQSTAELFKATYSRHLLDSTRLFDGVLDALNRLGWARFAVVTNKPERFSRRILDGLGVGGRFCSILGGDSVERRKPEPDSLLQAMRECHALPAESVMVGDSPIDIQAGKAAGVVTCGVTYGFRGKEELEEAGCDLIVNSLAELSDHFCSPDQK
jgi:phosphoglycolate phosphatase